MARAGEIVDGVADRVTLAGQSFFDPLPAGADLYLLKSVLNDWPDEPTVAILRRCAEAARQQTSIAILGGVAPDEAPRSLGIDMLVAGGKTSPLAQFTGLARQAGLDVVAARTQASGRFVVECRRAKARPHDPGPKPRSATARSATSSSRRPTGSARRRSTGVFGWETGEHYPDFESPGLIGEWVEGRRRPATPGP